MKTNIEILFVITLITIFLPSCDPGVTYHKVIQNDSDFDIKIKIYPESKNVNGAFYKNDSLVINKNSESAIYEYSSLGQTTEFKDCATYADSIVTKVQGNDALKLTINLNDKSNWNFSIINKTFKDGGTCECRLKITNEMIQ